MNKDSSHSWIFRSYRRMVSRSLSQGLEDGSPGGEWKNVLTLRKITHSSRTPSQCLNPGVLNLVKDLFPVGLWRCLKTFFCVTSEWGEGANRG